MATKVPARGSRTAAVMIVGEAPGRDEEYKGSPFVGSSGQELERMCNESGIILDDCFITNACKYRPPSNKMESWFYSKKKAHEIGRFEVVYGKYVHPYVKEGINELFAEIEDVQPQTIIVLGNTALWALTGEWGITKWRGSQLYFTKHPSEHLQKIKVIPTLHPAFIMRQWSKRPIALLDLKRAVRWHTGKCEQAPYNFKIRPSFTEVINTIEWLTLNRNLPYLSLDLETHNKHIAVLGIAWSKHDAICIPFLDFEDEDRSYWDAEQEYLIIEALRRLLDPRKGKPVVGQNFLYDIQYTNRWWGIEPKVVMDTMLAHHVCFPELPKSLDFLSSMYADWHVFWKDEGKQFEPKEHSQERWWTYNCKDAAITYEIVEVLANNLETYDLKEQFIFQMDMFEKVYETMKRGIKIDKKLRDQLYNELSDAMYEHEVWFESIIPESVHPRNPKAKPWYRSPQQQATLFYDELGVKEVIHRKTGGRTCDDDALETIMKREPVLTTICEGMQNYRSLGVLITNVIRAPLDMDGRMRCSYNVAGTKTFRLSSSENAFASGTNLQNITAGDEEILEEGEHKKGPRHIRIPNCRKLFVPDPGKVLLDVDLERADLQIVVWEAGDEKLKSILREGANVHIENAKDIFNVQHVDKSSSPDSMYHKAKQGVHATNYGAKPRTLSQHLGITVHEADQFQKRWFLAHPEIREWHNSVERQLMETRTVRNRFGFRNVFFDRIEEVLPKALAWIPQSTVALVINMGWRNIEDNLPWAEVLMQVHDSLVMQLLIENLRRVREIREQMSITIPYEDPLVLGLEPAISRKSWGDVEYMSWDAIMEAA